MKTFAAQKQFVNQWIRWLDSDMRYGIFSQWQKERQRELKEFLEELQSFMQKQDNSTFESELQCFRELLEAIEQENVESLPKSVLVAYENLCHSALSCKPPQQD